MRRAARLLRAVGLGAVVDRVKHGLRPLSLTFTLDVHGVRMGGESLAQFAQARAWAEGSKDACMTELFERSLRPGMVLVDVGAYIGYFTLIGARRVGPGGRVLAFEPNPRVSELLRTNVAANGLGDRVAVSRNALAASAGARPFFLDTTDPSASGLSRPSDGGTEIAVECATGDGALAGVEVDVLKIDVEGHELEVLEGMHETLRRSPSPVVFVEFNPHALVAAGVEPVHLLDLLHDIGLDVQVIDEERRRLGAATPELVERIPPGGYVNLLCAAPGR